MNCPKCNNINILKDGIVNGKQRFFCKPCDYHYTVQQRKQKPMSFKRIALALHIIGLSNRKIKEVINVSDVSIMHWVNKYSKHPELIRDTDTKIQNVNETDIRSIIKNNNNLIIIDINGLNSSIYKYIK